MEVGGGGPYRVRQSMSSHVEHRSYDFADHSMSCLSSPALVTRGVFTCTGGLCPCIHAVPSHGNLWQIRLLHH